MPIPINECVCHSRNIKPFSPIRSCPTHHLISIHGASSSSIQGMFASFVKVIMPPIETQHLGSIWFVWQICASLLTIVETLAVYYLAKRIRWDQLHTDMTTDNQASFPNLPISYYVNKNNDNSKDQDVAAFILSLSHKQAIRSYPC